MSENSHSKSDPPDREPVLPPQLDDSAADEIGARADTVWTRGPGCAPNIANVESQTLLGVGGGLAIVDGCLTPFCWAGTYLR
jgi:hypothetical protein